MTVKQKIVHNLLNIPGHRTGKKNIVFESDDWGSIRMPSKKAVDELYATGINVYSNPFNNLDALESEEDLTSLYEVLCRFKDHHGNHPVITANCIVANPDFDKIKNNNFQNYYWESAADTYAKYSNSTGALQLFKEGMSSGFIWPQFHGREHVNINQWLYALQNGDAQIMQAFDKGVFGIDFNHTRSIRNNFMAAFDFDTQLEATSKESIIKEGLDEFEKLYGIKSQSFIAPCYVWHPALEPILKKHGIDYIQGINYQFAPGYYTSKYKKIFHTQGQRNACGQRYLVRNAFFEPALNKNINWVEDCMQRIRTAFFWGKPAIIGTHRINFTGRLSIDNRENTHRLLQQLLQKITATWKDVAFTTSDKLGRLF